MIDPCMNPDGRDRYVNWFNSVVGSKYQSNHWMPGNTVNPGPAAEPIITILILNRDWAWQTQIETQQRMKYNQWLPQVHVDFHEQGINNPYYFAPAAEPFHEVITQWQRDFQTHDRKKQCKIF